MFNIYNNATTVLEFPTKRPVLISSMLIIKVYMLPMLQFHSSKMCF